MIRLSEDITVSGKFAGDHTWAGSSQSGNVVVRLFGADRRAALRESRARMLMQRLRHPSILPFVAAGTLEPSQTKALDARSKHWVATQLANQSDTSLRGASTLPLFEQASLSLLTAVEHLHARGWLHLDVKPANVLLHLEGEDHRYWLADFDSALPIAGAWSWGATGSVAGRDGVASGTAEYAAPEQRNGDWLSFGTWTDVYGIGRTVAEWGERVALPDAWSVWIERCVKDAPCDRFPDAKTALQECPAWRPGLLKSDHEYDELRDPIYVGRERWPKALAQARAKSENCWVNGEPGVGLSATLRASATALCGNSSTLVLPLPASRDAPSVRMEERVAIALGLRSLSQEDVVRALSRRYGDAHLALIGDVARWFCQTRGAKGMVHTHADFAALHGLASIMARDVVLAYETVTDVARVRTLFDRLEQSERTSVRLLVFEASSERDSELHGTSLLPVDRDNIVLAGERWGVPRERMDEFADAVSGYPGRIEDVLVRGRFDYRGAFAPRALREAYGKTEPNALALTAAAALGEEFERQVWVDVLAELGATAGRLVESELLSLGIWTETLRGTIQFCSPVMRRFLTEWAQADGHWVSVNRECVAAITIDAGASPDLLARVAEHASRGEMHTKAMTLWTRACRAAMKRSRQLDARQWATRAMERPEYADRYIELELIRVKAERRLSTTSHTELRRSLLRVCEVAEDAGLLDVHAGAMVERAVLALWRGDYAGASELARAGERVFTELQDAAATAFSLTILAQATRGAGNTDAAIALYERASHEFESVDDHHSAAHAELGIANTLCAAQRWEEALAKYRALLLSFEDDPAELGNVYNGLGEVASQQGDLSQSVALFEKAVELGERVSSSTSAEASANLGVAYARLGRYDCAEQQLAKAHEHLQRAGRKAALAYTQLWLRVIGVRENLEHDLHRRHRESPQSFSSEVWTVLAQRNGRDAEYWRETVAGTGH